MGVSGPKYIFASFYEDLGQGCYVTRGMTKWCLHDQREPELAEDPEEDEWE